MIIAQPKPTKQQLTCINGEDIAQYFTIIRANW